MIDFFFSQLHLSANRRLFYNIICLILHYQQRADRRDVAILLGNRVKSIVNDITSFSIKYKIWRI